MSENTEELSQIAPLLVAAVICDVAVDDPNTRKKTLVGIFDRVWARDFPTHRSLSLYVKIADALGRYNMQLKVVNISTGEQLAPISSEVVVLDKLQTTECLIHLQNMPMPTEGRYEFQLWFNDMYAGQTFLDAVLLAPEPRISLGGEDG